jgi:RNA polymerase sigma factor (sigma-70 family)
MSPPDGYDEQFDGLARIAYRVAYRVLGDREDACDVAQEALARAYPRWRKIEAYAEPWVARVAANLAVGQVRRRRRRGPLPESATDDLEPAAVERLELVRELQRLPRRQREVIALRFLADLTETQVATALGCSLGSVKKHSNRGLSTLRLARLAEDGV